MTCGMRSTVLRRLVGAAAGPRCVVPVMRQQEVRKCMQRLGCTFRHGRAFSASSAATPSDRDGDMEGSSSEGAEHGKERESGSSQARKHRLYEDPRRQILDAALSLVPQYGWTDTALAKGATAIGLPAISHGMFSRGAVELVEYFVEKCNKEWLEELDARKEELAALPTAKMKLKVAAEIRLRKLVPYLSYWPQALAVGLLPQNLESTAKILARIADELCHASDDRAVDLTWYRNRATVCWVYISTELFLLTDYSEGFTDTWAFLDRRLAELEALAKAPQNVQQGVLAFNIAAGALASAAASLVQPGVWQAVQKIPLTSAMFAALHTILAHMSASPSGVTGTARSADATSLESDAFPPPPEHDPYEDKGNAADEDMFNIKKKPPQSSAEVGGGGV